MARVGDSAVYQSDILRDRGNFGALCFEYFVPGSKQESLEEKQRYKNLRPSTTESAGCQNEKYASVKSCTCSDFAPFCDYDNK